MMLAAVGAPGQVLAPVLDPAHRPAKRQRRPGREHFLRAQDALVAKAAADIGGDHADSAVVDTQTVREAGAHHMRHLRGGIEHDLLGLLVVISHDATTLDRRHALARGAERPLHDGRRPGDRGLEADVDGGLEKDVLGPMFVDERRVRIAGARHLRDRRQRLDVEQNRFGKVFRFRARWRKAGGDRLADMPDLLVRQHGLDRTAKARKARIGFDAGHAAQVGGDEDARLEACGLDHGTDASVRDRTAHKGDVEHSRQLDVGDKPALAREKPRILASQDRRADALARVFLGGPGDHRPALAAKVRIRPAPGDARLRPRPRRELEASPRRSEPRPSGRSAGGSTGRRSPRPRCCRTDESGRVRSR